MAENLGIRETSRIISKGKPVHAKVNGEWMIVTLLNDFFGGIKERITVKTSDGKEFPVTGAKIKRILD